MSSVHIIGAGMAGLAAAVGLRKQGREVIVYEAAPFAGGRCRSFYSKPLDAVIDNGNHLILGCNQAVMRYVRNIGAENRFERLSPVYPFYDLTSGERWSVGAPGALLRQMLRGKKPIPGTCFSDYLKLAGFMRRGAQHTVHELPLSEAIHRRFITPFCESVLNTAPEKACAALLQTVMKEVFQGRAQQMTPWLPRKSLDDALVQPALDWLDEQGATVYFGWRLQRLETKDQRITALKFAQQGEIALTEEDSVVLALPPWAVSELLPDVPVPDQFSPILNIHYRVDDLIPFHRRREGDRVPFIGIVGGIAQWVFLRPPVISVTVSAAEKYLSHDLNLLAEKTWQEIYPVLDLPEQLPPRQVIMEKRATFRATPEVMKRRPQNLQVKENLFIAGDYVDTGLPATIESAIRSGEMVTDLFERQ